MNWTEDTPSLNESNANETVADRGIGVGANVTLSRDSTRIPNNMCKQTTVNYKVLMPYATYCTFCT